MYNNIENNTVGTKLRTQELSFKKSIEQKQSMKIASYFNYPELQNETDAYIIVNLSGIIELVNGLENIHLKRFIKSIFCNRNFLSKFAYLSASKDHHHNWKGGLLAHSLECALFCKNSLATISNISASEKEIAIVVSLLHDVGKIKTLTLDNKNSVIGNHIKHEELTLSILALYTDTLESVWESGAALLMQLLSSSKNNQRYNPNPVAVVIKNADQMSTALNLRDKAFYGQPSYFYFTSYETNDGKQFVNRLVA